MKLLLPAFLGLLSFSSLTLANEALERGKKQCETPEAKEMMGATGSCRVIIMPQELKSKNGFCMGKLKDELCTIQYVVLPQGSSVQLADDAPAEILESNVVGISIKCGTEKHEMDAEAFTYRLIVIVTNPQGEEVLIEQPYSYTSIESKVARVSLVEEAGRIQSYQFQFSLGLGSAGLSDLQCFDHF